MQETETIGIIIRQNIQTPAMIEIMKEHLILTEARRIDETEMIETEEETEIEAEVLDKIIGKVDGTTPQEAQEIWPQIELEISLNQVLQDQLDPLEVQIHPLPHRPMP